MKTRIVKETSTDGKVRYRCEKCITIFFGIWEQWETMTYPIPKKIGEGTYYAIFDKPDEAENFLHPITKEVLKVYE